MKRGVGEAGSELAWKLERKSRCATSATVKGEEARHLRQESLMGSSTTVSAVALPYLCNSPLDIRERRSELFLDVDGGRLWRCRTKEMACVC